MLTRRKLTLKMSKSDTQQINGILLVNKPQGLSSNAVLQRAKRLFNAKKAGHTGSLDPLATGMLPVCFGEATKICQYLLDSDKSYQATGLLGIKTDTADALGEAIAVCEQFDISLEQLQSVLSGFVGTVNQVPSMYSALKHKGQPLYKYARKGIDIDRPARQIIIDRLQLNQFDGKSFSITVSCSKGTYIRNLVEDIGELLGVHAHVTALHRLYTAGFETSPMYTLEELTEMSPDEMINCLIPMEDAVDYLPSIHLTEADIAHLRQGKIIPVSDQVSNYPVIRLFDPDGLFVGLGEGDTNTDTLKAKRLLAF